MTTPKLAIPEITESQASKYITHNEALRALEAISSSVISKTTTAEPGTPGDGDAYILPASPTGTTWATLAENDLVYRSNGAWKVIAPAAGLNVRVNDEELRYESDGVGWAPINGAASVTLGEPNHASSVFHPSFIGADGSTSFTDQSPSAHTITTVGGAQISSNSLLLDGANDYLTVPDSADFDFGAGAFSIAVRFSVTSIGGTQTIISQYTTSGNQRSWHLYVKSTGVIGFNWSTTGTNVLGQDSTGTVLANTEYEVLVGRDSSNQLRIHIDGVNDTSVANAVTYHNSTGVLSVGATAAAADDFGGTIKALKVWKGVAPVATDSSYDPDTADLFGTQEFTDITIASRLVNHETAPNILPSYTVATVPTASTKTGGMIYVTNETGGAIPAFSDGTNWRRVSDRAIVA